ncbi:MAG: ABC transporter substrate-binding protein [Proteobacteria bacterium]|nr:ABC transporter substrate-binding protein [Pseudomonadota bacterium]
MSRGTRATIRAGFIPLVDAAPLIAASRLGFAETEGIEIELEREMSWATMRDRMAVRHLDVAHMLAAMAIADRIGIAPLRSGLIVPMGLGIGGNAITVSNAVWRDLEDAGAPTTLDAAATSRAMADVVARRAAAGCAKLSFGIVHPHSAHHYQLAYWLGYGGVDPSRDVTLVVVPPPLMAAALASGQVDGYCVGEPWGSVAVADGYGQVVTTSAKIWERSPDKVLGVRQTFAEEAPDALKRLVRAVYKAAVWCDAQDNAEALAELLARPELIGASAKVIAQGLDRRRTGGAGFLSFAAGGGTVPLQTQALWFYAQMVRWGQAALTDENVTAASATYRADLYREALAPLGVAMPDAATISAGDRFFDGRVFDGERIGEYLAGFEIRSR